MKVNNEGIQLIKSCEGCRLTAYKNKGERNYTIGYGHSDSTIKAGQTITQTQADNLLIKDLEKFENYVTKYALAKFPGLNENEFSALVSYCYNRGPKGLKELVDHSTNETNLGWNILVYWGTNKNYETALKNRRKKEQKLFYKNFVDIPQTVTTVCDLKVPTPTLKRGCRGREVEYLQEFLHLNNPFVVCKIDGIFGEQTYKALKTFQSANGLVSDGIYGRLTRDKVKSLIYR